MREFQAWRTMQQTWMLHVLDVFDDQGRRRVATVTAMLSTGDQQHYTMVEGSSKVSQQQGEGRVKMVTTVSQQFVRSR